jgi:CPA2 family monovalent cation:H+ antiporter-2
MLMRMNALLTIFLTAALDQLVITVSMIAILVIMLGWILRYFKQPYVIGYILIGAALGQHGLGLVSNNAMIEQMGEIGIVLLLFFIGMEISLPDLVKQWKVAVIGTLLQLGLSVGFVIAFGSLFDWSLTRSVILGFVIALSSSAVIIKILQEKHIIHYRLGRSVLSILLMQDVIIVPLLITTSLIGGGDISTQRTVKMIVGGMLLIGTLVYLYRKRQISLPFSGKLAKDQELQVFIAILFCSAGALLSSLFGLSAALGAFVGGLMIHASKSTEWIHESLHSFRIVFVAVFFISIGLQLDLGFIAAHYKEIGSVLVLVYITNHLINSLILRLFGTPWKEAVLGGALLAQIGELSFLLAFSAYRLEVISDFGYKFSIALISLTLFISPFWIMGTEKILHRYRAKKILATGHYVK